MSIRDLRTFLAIVESGSFAGAARAIHRTQSAVTMQVKALEDELGFALFDRAKRPPALTDAGRAFVRKAVEAVEAYDRLFQHGDGDAVEGHLRLGVVPSAVTGIVPKALVALRAKYPRLHVEVLLGLSADLVERLRHDLVDAAIVSELLESRSGLRWSPFLREPLGLIAPPDAPDVSAEELIELYPFIRYTRQAWVGQLIDRLVKRRKLRVREVMRLDTLEAITSMVHHGLGVSIVPLRTAERPAAPPVRSVPFPGPPVYRVIGLVRAAAHPKAALADALLAELEAVGRAAEGPAARAAGRQGPAARRGARRRPKG